MYKRFFGLRDNPFNINPDPRYLFLTPQTRRALDQLTYGIQTRQGLIVLTGEVGTGKTTVINRLRAWLHQQEMPTAFIFNSHLGTGQLFDYMLADFGVPPAVQSNDNATRLNQWLLSRHRAGELPVLIVDEAQGLPTDVLEEIRMLLNWETPEERLLQIVLAGQPELEAKLNCPGLRQLKQRVAFRCRTTALTLQETYDYIQSRLKTAGAQGKQIFASEAVQAVYFYSRGIPRVINLLCEHALINAYVDGVRLVPAQSIAEIAHDLQFDDEKHPASINFAVAGPADANIEQSINPDTPNNEMALPLSDALASASLIEVGETPETPRLHCVAGPPHADEGAMSIPLIHAWTIFDGSKSELRVNEMNVATGRQLIAELSASQPVPIQTLVQTPCIASEKISANKIGRASNDNGKGIFDGLDWDKFDWLANRVKSRVTTNALRVSHVLRPMIGCLGVFCHDASRVTSRVLGRAVPLLAPWSPQSLVQRFAATPQAETFLNRCLSASPVAGTLRVGKPLLRWLREPMRPTQPGGPSRRRPTVVRAAATRP